VDQKDLIRLLDEQGFERELNGSGHYTIRRHGRRITTISKSPGKNGRALKNALSTLRRAGLKVPR
jgi:hypothetical protein